MRKRLIATALPVVLAAVAVAAPAPALAADGQSASPAPQSTLDVGVQVVHFAVAGRRLTANGIATATLTDPAGNTTEIKQPIALSASTAGSCRVLHLQLDELTLALLGLNAHLDKVNLDITGQRHGGVLGKLFCRLASGVKAARASVGNDVRALNARLRRRRLSPLHFTATLTPQARAADAAGGPTCQVLDLVVGPLNLELLGLVVDLQKVHLNVSATPGGGVLGDLFCSLGKR